MIKYLLFYSLINLYLLILAFLILEEIISILFCYCLSLMYGVRVCVGRVKGGEIRMLGCCCLEIGGWEMGGWLIGGVWGCGVGWIIGRVSRDMGNVIPRFPWVSAADYYLTQ